jgi:F-type H+-transporting ATPase subunit gamma
MKALKRRIASVSNTQQIMKAMDMVAASKLQKAKAMLDAARPLYKETQRIIGEVKNFAEASGNIFVAPREVKSTAVILITSDRGLCGGYNVNVAKKALSFLAGVQNEKIIAAGMRGKDYFRRFGKNIERRYTGIETNLSGNCSEIAAYIYKQYTEGEIDEAYIAYTEFQSALSHIPRVLKLLPLGGGTGEPEDDVMNYDPDVNTFLENAVPMYLKQVIYGAMLESITCEQAARMTSMHSATNNAKEVIEELTLLYNRRRQDIITQEINEIVSSANALK